MTIFEALENLEQSNSYPFHMPGHKRQTIGDGFPYGMDITEIDGFDDLHHPEGILKTAQDKAAAVYSAEKAYYLVNGSTCGILAAISAAVPRNGRVLAARNCHKAVYHALALRNAAVTYLSPAVDEYGICGAIEPELVKEALDGSEFDACILTSPTYEGVVSSISEIAELLHEKQIPLIVDQAHGAHFGFSEHFPESAAELGADAVIVSLHKTLPAPTQTALLLLCSNRIDAGKTEYYLDVYETSSPSYVLMAAMERAIDYSDKSREIWAAYQKKLDHFYKVTETCENPAVLRTDDSGKIILLGKDVGKWLRKNAQIEVEMESSRYAVLMTSFMDTEDGFRRLEEAVLEMNRENYASSEMATEKNFTDDWDFAAAADIIEASEITMGDALEAESLGFTEVEAIGRTAAEFVYVYPPGIPVLVPGEKISKEAAEYLKMVREHGLAVKGTYEDGKIRVLK